MTKKRISRLRRKTRLGRRVTSASASEDDAEGGISTAEEDRSDTPTEATATVAEVEDLEAEDKSTDTEAEDLEAEGLSVASADDGSTATEAEDDSAGCRG